MRIWHQWSGVLDPPSEYHQALEAHIRAVAGDGVTVDFHGVSPEWAERILDAVPKDAPNTRHGFNYIWTLHREGLVRGALQAEAEGYDAFFISMINDAGFEEIRSLLKIPVIAYTQSSILLAATLGAPIGFVTFVEAVEEQIRQLVSTYGFQHLVGPIERASLTYPDVLGGFGDPSAAVAKFTEAAERAIAQGAKVIIPGEAPLNTLIAHAGVSEIAGVPVIDSMGVAIAFAEMRSKFFRRTGLTHSQVGFFYATPPKELVEVMTEYYSVR